MTTPPNMGAYWDRRSEDFDTIYTGGRSRLGHLWDRLTRKNLQVRFEFALRTLECVSGKRILDVGCGSGRYCVELADRGAAQVVGVDVSEKMLALGRRAAAERGVQDTCSFVRTDVLEYRPAERFDGIVAMGFFDYVRDLAAVMGHLGSLLRGQLVASFPVSWAFRAPFRKVWLTLRGCPVYFFTAEEIRQACRQAGLTCRTLTRSGPIYLLIAEPARA
ncbi:MAG TPA: class I SAM-dependent methyltransferase [Phycisphaerae bacterium]|nr:class I SAM-dependent methyltransferase [Phycisphaerae bacterium]